MLINIKLVNSTLDGISKYIFNGLRKNERAAGEESQEV